jgi:drug/metabolite transporter superfamily protein YnfA
MDRVIGLFPPFLQLLVLCAAAAIAGGFIFCLVRRASARWLLAFLVLVVVVPAGWTLTSMLEVPHPLLLLVGLFAAAAIACCFAVCFARRAPARWLLAIGGLVFAAPAGWAFTVLHPELFDARFRAFKQLYGEIHAEMTRDEVLQLVDQHYPVGGLRGAPKLYEESSEKLGFFMNPEFSTEPNCEAIILTMRVGRVERKEYSPD